MIAILLTVQSFAFLFWAIEMFRVLFHLRAMAEAETGQVFSGPVTSLRMVRGWLKDPARRGQRIRLLALTVLLFALNVAFALVRSTSG